MRPATHDSRKVAAALMRKHGERALIIYGKPYRTSEDKKEMKRLSGWVKLLKKLTAK